MHIYITYVPRENSKMSPDFRDASSDASNSDLTLKYFGDESSNVLQRSIFGGIRA